MQTEKIDKPALARTQPTDEEKAQRMLGMYEKTIQHGMNFFIEVGMALKAIRDGKLYKAEFRTFEEYCSKRWNLSKTHVNRKIAAASIAADLTPIGVEFPITESLVRPIIDLEPDQQTKVWQQAVETAPKGKLTAKHVAEIAAQHKKMRRSAAEPSPSFDADTWTLRARHAVNNIVMKWPQDVSLQPLIDEIQNCLDSLKKRCAVPETNSDFGEHETVHFTPAAEDAAELLECDASICAHAADSEAF